MSDDLEKFIGRSVVTEDVITPAQVKKLAVTLNRDDPILRAGDPVPPGWHHIFFHQLPRTESLGGDGMVPELQDGPDDPLPIRMFAGSQARYHRPLRIGDSATQERKLVSIKRKEGRSGKLVFAKYGHRISGPEGLCTEDNWDLVFMEEDKHGTRRPPAPQPAPDNAAWERTIEVSESMLFRFSAVTFNAHRIHYDYPYATGVEGYPGLVVHGPLTATWLLELARNNNPGRTVSSFQMQAKAPLFANQPLKLLGRPSEDHNRCDLWAVNAHGDVAMDAAVTFG